MNIAIITNSESKILFTLLLNMILLVIFALIYILVIKMKKANYFNAIALRQNFIAFSMTIYIFALLPIYLSCFIWVVTFFFLREFVFRNDEIRMYQLCLKYNKNSGYPFPKISNFSQLKEAFFPVQNTKLRYKDHKYSFLSYSNTGLWLIFFLLLKVVETSKTINVLYFAESIIIASIIFVFIGRFIFHISFYNPNSASFGSEIGSCIFVFLIGIVYYFVIIVILIKIHGLILFHW